MKTNKNITTPNIIADKDKKLPLLRFKSIKKTPTLKITNTRQLKTKSSIGTTMLRVLKKKSRNEKASQCNLIQNTKSLSKLPTVASYSKYQKKTLKQKPLLIPPKQNYIKSRRNIFKNISMQEFSIEISDSTTKKNLSQLKTSAPLQKITQLSIFTKKSKSISKVPIVISPQKSQKKNIKITAPEFLSSIRFLGPRKSIIESNPKPKIISPTPRDSFTENITNSRITKPAPRFNFMRNKIDKDLIVKPPIDESPKDEPARNDNRLFSVRSTPSRTLQLKIDAQNTKMKDLLEKIQVSKPVSQISLDSKMPQQDKKDLKNTAIQTAIILDKKEKTTRKKSVKNKKSQTEICTLSTNIVSPFQNKIQATRKMYVTRASSRRLQPLDPKTQAQREKMLQSLQEVPIQLPEVNWTLKNSPLTSMQLDSLKESPIKNHKVKSVNKISIMDKTSPIKGNILADKNLNKNSNLLTIEVNSEKDNVDRLLVKDKSSGRKYKLKKLFTSGLQFPKTKTGIKEQFTMTSNDLSVSKKTKLTMTSDDLSSSKEPTNKLLTKTRPKSITTIGDSDKIKDNKLTRSTSKDKKREVQVGNKPHDAELKGVVTNALATHDTPSAECKATLDELFRSPETQLTHEKYNLKGAVSTLVPVKNLSLVEKEHVLRTETELGIPLEGKTMSEKILLAKMNAQSKAASDALALEVKKVKAAGLLRPIKCETLEKKEKVIKELIRQGLPLLEAKTSAEKKIMSNVRADLCKLSTTSDNINRADIANSLIPFLNLQP